MYKMNWDRYKNSYLIHNLQQRLFNESLGSTFKEENIGIPVSQSRVQAREQTWFLKFSEV